jgi:hypothetical protein
MRQVFAMRPRKYAQTDEELLKLIAEQRMIISELKKRIKAQGEKIGEQTRQIQALERRLTQDLDRPRSSRVKDAHEPVGFVPDLPRGRASLLDA